MATLRPFDKMPLLDAAAVLMVGCESEQELIAGAMLREPKTFDVKIHMTPSLPLAFEGDHLRPNFDLIVFLINLCSQHSLSAAMASLTHLDASFYLGKVCFVATKGLHGQLQHCALEATAVRELAARYMSTLIQCELDNEDDVSHTAQRLLHMLRVCAGLVPGVSALYMSSLLNRTPL